jgi:AAA15 family ATPase/GTPase
LSYDAEKILSEELYITESTKAALAYSRRHDTVSARPVIQFGTKLKLSKKSQQAIIANTINNATILAAFGKTNVEPSLLDEVYAFFSGSLKTVLQPNMLLSDFVKSALKEDTSEKLRNFLVKMLKLSDFNIVDMDVHEEKVTKHTELNFKHQSDAGIFTLPEELESIGTIRFMGMSVLLSRLLLTDNVVSIDEVESSIHYELVSYFIKVFLANSRKDSQLLITTHDINLMNEDFLRRDVLWSTDKMDSGATTLRRFSEMGLHKTQSIYNAYRQGKLGKLPFLGSIYLNLEDME